MRRILLLAIVWIATSMPGSAWAQPAISSEIAPTGKLRVAMNAQTPVLLRRTPDGKTMGGVGLELGKFIAEKLGVSFELAPYANSNTYTQSFGKGEWDVGFGTQTPLIADKADFILDVLLTDYMFVAAPGREFADAAQVDRPRSQDRGWDELHVGPVPQPHAQIRPACAHSRRRQEYRGATQWASGCVGSQRK
jgi:polar amino acid transport system substrate-binding protein